MSTAGGLYAELPDGLPTKSDAIRAWLDRAPEFGVSFVIDESDGKAWIIREDGTASAKVGFLRHRGFTVHGYDACSPLD